jgi:hypothetical protein
MAGITNNPGISPLFDRWITDEWLTYTRGSRFLLITARLHVVCMLIFLLFLAPARSWLEALLRHLGGRIVFGLGGALTALTGMVLVDGMRRYWKRIDDSSKARKKLWFWILTLGVNIGACVYCFLVYWPQRRSAEAISNR